MHLTLQWFYFRSNSEYVCRGYYWGRVTHICVSKLTIIGSDNGLSPSRRQAIIVTNAGILLIGPLTTSSSEMLFEIHMSSFKKKHLKMLSGKMAAILLRPRCVNLMLCDVSWEMVKYYLAWLFRFGSRRGKWLITWSIALKDELIFGISIIS